MKVQVSKPQVASGLSAFGMAALTLLIFTMLRNYGPESVLKRFHEVIAHDQRSQLSRYILVQSSEGITPQEALMLQEVQDATHSGTYRIIGVTEGPGSGQARAEVAYDVPGYPPDRETWVLIRTRTGWMIDLPQTAEYRFESHLRMNL